MQNHYHLQDFVASRICHDIVSPTSATQNGLELLLLDGGADNETVGLVQQSSKRSIDVIRFLRMAFGTASTSEMVKLDAVRQIMIAYYENRFDVVIGSNNGTNEVSRLEAKLLLLTSLCLVESFAKPSSLEIFQHSTGWELSCRGQGNLTNDGEVRTKKHWEDEQELTSSQIHFPLAKITAADAGYKIMPSFGEENKVGLERF